MQRITSADALDIAKICIARNIVWFVNNNSVIVSACDPDLKRIKLVSFTQSEEYRKLTDLYSHTPLLSNKSILANYIEENDKHSPGWDKKQLVHFWVGLEFFEHNTVTFNQRRLEEKN